MVGAGMARIRVGDERCYELERALSQVDAAGVVQRSSSRTAQTSASRSVSKKKIRRPRSSAIVVGAGYAS